jgi:hypothetical protein
MKYCLFRVSYINISCDLSSSGDDVMWKDIATRLFKLGTLLIERVKAYPLFELVNE